jgi:hypothetical protein
VLDVSAVSAAAGSVTGGVSGGSSADGAVATTVSPPPVEGAGSVEGDGVLSVGNDSGATAEVLDATLSPADVAEPVWAPPELCTPPDRGSVVFDVDSAADVAEPGDDGPADAEPDAESVDTLDAELDESDDDEDELESDGSATATHGVVATAAPMPSATASAPTRPMYFALPIVAPPPYTNARLRIRGVIAMETNSAVAGWVGESTTPVLPGGLRDRVVDSKPDWGSGLPQFRNATSVKLSSVSTDARRAESLQRLPLPYATALRMRDAGIIDEVIAECVAVDVDALPTFMRVAEAKLAAASREPPAQARRSRSD